MSLHSTIHACGIYRVVICGLTFHQLSASALKALCFQSIRSDRRMRPNMLHKNRPSIHSLDASLATAQNNFPSDFFGARAMDGTLQRSFSPIPTVDCPASAGNSVASLGPPGREIKLYLRLIIAKTVKVARRTNYPKLKSSTRSQLFRLLHSSSSSTTATVRCEGEIKWREKDEKAKLVSCETIKHQVERFIRD